VQPVDEYAVLLQQFDDAEEQQMTSYLISVPSGYYNIDMG
jgi:hypothetical protein